MKKITLIPILTLLGAAFLAGCTDAPEIQPDIKGVRPIVFVHGFAGSGDQFQSQGLRFTSNGYPLDYINAFDHNTIWELDRQSNLEAFVDSVLAKTGADKVDLVGHSMGTSISATFLSDAENAAKIAHYVNVDGFGGDYPPGGVPTINIMATSLAEEIIGAENIVDPTTHVEAITSLNTFAHMYEFFTGLAPTTTDILPEASPTIELSGRFQKFITNTIPEDSILSIFEIDTLTGQRLYPSSPDHSQAIGEDGAFAFPNAKQGSSYEFNVSLIGQSQQGHYYYEPFLRSDNVIRLKFSEPGEVLFETIERTDDSTALLVIRNREMQGSSSDITGTDYIQLNGVELCAGVLPGGNGVADSGPMVLLTYDAGTDGASDFDNLRFLSWDATVDGVVPFVNVVDHFIPSDLDASGTNIISITDRVTTDTYTINFPTWSASTHTVMTQFLAH